MFFQIERHFCWQTRLRIAILAGPSINFSESTMAYAVTVSSPFRLTLRNIFSKKVGAVVLHTEKPKLYMHKDLLEAEAIDSTTIELNCMRALGCWAKKSIRYINSLAAQQKGASASTQKQSLTARLLRCLFRLQSVAVIQRGQNADEIENSRG